MKEKKENVTEQWVDDLRRERLKGSSRNPGTAALMSFFVMGLGQIYAGHIDRGIMLMAIYLGAIFSGFSAYNGGIVYNAVFPLIGAHLMVVISYIVSVVFILLWIYNIKDAYYLSLFSSFRDWFEVERVLLPVLQGQTGGLLTGPSKASALLTHNPQADYKPEPAAASMATEHEDADVVEVKSSRPEEDEDVLEPGQVVYAADFGAMKMQGQSWKLYLGLVLMFVLIGLWLEKLDTEVLPQSMREQSTLFAVSGDLKTVTPGAAQIESISGKNPSVEAFQQAALPVEKTPEPAVPAVVAPVPAVDKEAVVTPPVPEPQPVMPFATGLEQVKAGNYIEAAKLFEAALAAHEPEKAEWRVILNSFYRADSLVAYEVNLRRYLNTYTDDAAAWFNLGKMLYDRSELAQASQAIVKGLRFEPDNVRGNYLLGSIYIDLKLHTESISYLERALAMEPLNIDFNRQLARALKASSRVEESARYYQRILSLAPDDVEASQALATVVAQVKTEDQVLVVQGKGEGRLIEKQAASTSEIPETPEVIEPPVTGKVLFEAPVQTQPVQVVQTVQAAQPVEPVQPVQVTQPVQVQPAQTVQVAQVIQPAQSAQQVQTIQPTQEKPVVTLPASEKTSEVDHPEQTFEARGTMVVPENKELPIVIANVRPIMPSVPSSIAGKAAAPNATPVVAVVTATESAPSIKEAQAASETGSNESEFRDFIAQEPDKEAVRQKIEGFRKKGAAEFSRGNWEGALPSYLEVLKYKKDAQTYDMIGVIFEKLAMHKDAFDAVERSYRLGRKDAVTLTRLGRLAETTGNFVKGEQYLKQALLKSPHRVDLRIRYAKCLEANGNADQAIAELEKIARAGGDSYALKRRAELEINRIMSARK